MQRGFIAVFARRTFLGLPAVVVGKSGGGARSGLARGESSGAQNSLYRLLVLAFKSLEMSNARSGRHVRVVGSSPMVPDAKSFEVSKAPSSQSLNLQLQSSRLKP